MPPKPALDPVVNAEFAGAGFGENLPPPVRPEFAFAGKSNVGKSSLLNLFMNRRSLARVSGTPGATRAIGIYRVELRSGPTIDLVDLPGYGYAVRSKSERKIWNAEIASFLAQRAGLRTVFVLIDGRRGVSEDDADVIDLLQDLKREAIPVLTKIDKATTKELAAAEQSARKALRKEKAKIYRTSATTKEGRESLIAHIERAVGPQLSV